MKLVKYDLKLDSKLGFLSNIRSKYFFIDAEIRQVMQIFLKTQNIKDILKH